MKIIGAGYPRTGTMSTQEALRLLGYRCYHMKEVPVKRGHLNTWSRFINGRSEIKWESLFRDFDATVDAPACFYYEDLMNQYPNAKVILTVRDPEKWYSSLKVLSDTVTSFHKPILFATKFKKFIRLSKKLMTQNGLNTNDKPACINVFNDHNKRVKEIVPDDRLLIFRVDEGWGPLCEFLGCEPPKGIEFPHLNAGDETLKAMMRRSFVHPKTSLVIIALTIAAATLAVVNR